MLSPLQSTLYERVKSEQLLLRRNLKKVTAAFAAKEYVMIRLIKIVCSPVRVLSAVLAVAGLLAITSAQAPAGVLQESGKSNLIIRELNQAGKSNAHVTLTRYFVPSKGSITVSTMPGGGLIGDSLIRVKVVNVSTGQTVLNQTATLSFANGSRTFSWNVATAGSGYRMTVTNRGSNKPLLMMEVK